MNDNITEKTIGGIFIKYRIIRDIQRVRFKIIKTYRIFENPYHRFFMLKK